jgi:hypothetical protein
MKMTKGTVKEEEAEISHKARMASLQTSCLPLRASTSGRSQKHILLAATRRRHHSPWSLPIPKDKKMLSRDRSSDRRSKLRFRRLRVSTLLSYGSPWSSVPYSCRLCSGCFGSSSQIPHISDGSLEKEREATVPGRAGSRGWRRAKARFTCTRSKPRLVHRRHRWPNPTPLAAETSFERRCRGRK